MVGLLGAAGVAAATGRPAVDTSAWRCRLCPFELGERRESQTQLDIVGVSGATARFGRYSGWEEDGTTATVNALVSDGDARGRRWRVDAERLGAETASVALHGAAPRWAFSVGTSQLPNHLFDTTRTPWSIAAGTSLTLPDGWVRGLN
ncbi:MAG: MtrB/PioB family outer membrane beta-barrel protein, partial [Gammaproteobacteria bacterium]|nr:MtrB/PioB family outer membrane beta-barrel protein [Gammaproteobacteria bacterium]